MADLEVRRRMLDATVTCVGRTGMEGLTVEQVADEAGVGRATVYRYFSGGRDQLVSEAVTWEVAGFFTRLAEELEDAHDLRDRLERGLLLASRTLGDHEVFQYLMEHERERLLVRLTDLGPLTLGVLRGYLSGLLADEQLAVGVEPEAAADYLARMVLSFLTSPGSWDLEDPAQRAELVQTEFLSGVLASGPPG